MDNYMLKYGKGGANIEITKNQKIIILTIMAVVLIMSLFLKQSVLNKSDMMVESQIESTLDSEEMDYIIVDVEGAVLKPGIVKLPEGSRVYEALAEAGGILDHADTKYVNQARILEDGEVIFLPDILQEAEENKNNAMGNDLININTADAEELMKLPGIGQAYAQSIIEYRESNGYFNQIEDLLNVSGIGLAKFENMKDLICVY